MRKVISMLLVAVMCLGSVGALADTNVSVVTQTPAVNGSVDMGVLSGFMSRGRLFNDETVFQPQVNVNVPYSCGVFSINVWENMLNYFEKDAKTANEVDVTLSYLNTIDLLTYGGGVIDYIYSGQDVVNSHEVFINASLAIPKAFALNPTILVVYDFKQVEGYYFNAGLTHTFNVISKAMVTVDSGVGYATENYNQGYFGVEKNALNDWSTSMTVSYKISKGLTAYVGTRYVTLLDSDIKDGAVVSYGDSSKWVQKIGATCNF